MSEQTTQERIELALAVGEALNKDYPQHVWIVGVEGEKILLGWAQPQPPARP